MNPRIREDDKGPGLEKNRKSTNEENLCVSYSVLFRVIPWQMLFLCFYGELLTLVKFLDAALAQPFQNIQIPLGIQGQRMGRLELARML